MKRNPDGSAAGRIGRLFDEITAGRGDAPRDRVRGMAGDWGRYVERGPFARVDDPSATRTRSHVMTPFAPATASAIVATGLLAMDAGPHPPHRFTDGHPVVCGGGIATRASTAGRTIEEKCHAISK